MNNEKYLPVGTVVLLKGGKKRVMVIGFVAIGENNPDLAFDYVGCLYPEGLISSDKNLMFNHDQIERIDYLGLIDDEEKQYKAKLKDYVENGLKESKEDSIEIPISLQDQIEKLDIME